MALNCLAIGSIFIARLAEKHQSILRIHFIYIGEYTKPSIEMFYYKQKLRYKTRNSIVIRFQQFTPYFMISFQETQRFRNSRN